MSKLGVGFMRHSNISESQALVDYAMSHGQNYFETCWFYQDYTCEDYVYSLLKKYPRKDYTICGKMPIQNIIERENFIDIYKKQLNKVPGGYFDIYLLQAITPHCLYWIESQQLISFFDNEKKKGNIKQFGVSFQCDAACAETVLSRYDWDICQIPLNYYDYFLSESKKLYELLKGKNIPIIAQAPVKGGLLLDTKTITNSFSNGQDLLQNSYNFLFSLHPEIILCGTSSLEHYKENFKALLNASEFNFKEGKKVIDSYKNSLFIRCWQCDACYDVCPAKFPIGPIFQLHNKGLVNYDSFLDLQILLDTIGIPSNECYLSQCNADCEKVCPMNIPIREYLAKRIFERRL